MYNPKESSSMVKLINLSRCRSKWCMHACIDDGFVGPQMEASHVSVLARIYMHVAQKGVVWCLNNQFHNFDVARASETEKSRHWVRCTCSGTRTYSIYASPLPPLRRVLYTTITQTKRFYLAGQINLTAGCSSKWWTTTLQAHGKRHTQVSSVV